ncbi:MAG: UDP-N-acetylmuramoyl-L-alanine--D-glutamate ligase, partial [Alphaproteobacteria bacterium]|nr:UDP-N-acetylmuramoyl-L-alanine--D-glutamate ligase [Alphaproteobacteria bacterium]
VFGLARSGLAAIRALKDGGARVYAGDDKESAFAAAEAAGAHVASFSEWPWERIKALVLSPGVPLTHPAPHAVVARAAAAKVPVFGDMELFAREIGAHAPVIAVTGTNGKSTTTALIGHVLEALGHKAEIGGNIGKPALELAPPAARTVYVLEVSSYQIDLSPGLKPAMGVLTNITPDHIERHGSLDAYATLKGRLIEQSVTAAIGIDDSRSAELFTRLSAAGKSAVPVSVGKVLGRGVFVLDGVLHDSQGGRADRICDLNDAAHLRGAHNWQNAALAYAAAKPWARDGRALAGALLDFPGLAHRIEDVGRIGKVRFVNDSKATNADAAERALLCFDDIFWIAGGRAKQGGIESLRRLWPRIRKAYLIGEAASDFSRTLEGQVPFEMSGTLETAVAQALADAARSEAGSPVVLLSPACASFDQFNDFEQRGDAFRAAVARLAMKEAS